MQPTKRVIVTGSTSGIGLGIAKRFAESGCQIVLNGIEPSAQVQSTLDEMKQLSGHDALYSSADLCTVAGCHDIVDKTLELLGGVDIIVNNAGVQFTAPAVDFPEKEWHRIIQLNLEAAFFISQRALSHMYKQKWGRLIHISSAHGLVASRNKVAYVTAKHGLMGLSKTIALESAGTGVTSNTICPGWTYTPLVEKQVDDLAKQEHCSFEEAKRKLLLAKQPSGEFATPEQMGGLALFLASSDADQITGAAITVDGGWTLP